MERGGFEANAEVTVGADGRFELVLWIRAFANEGTRTLAADTCEALLKVAAFSIALAVNPELVEEEATPRPRAPPPQEEPASPRPAPLPKEEAPPRRMVALTPRASVYRHGTELWFGMRAIGDTSLLPSAAFGLGGTADVVTLAPLRFGLGGQAFIPQEHLLSGGTGGVFSLWAIEAHACFEPLRAERLSFCALFQGGVVAGSGRGVETRLEQRSTLLAPGASLSGRFALGRRVAAVLGGTFLVPLSHDRFVVNAGEVHEIPRVSVEAQAGVEIRAF